MSGLFCKIDWTAHSFRNFRSWHHLTVIVAEVVTAEINRSDDVTDRSRPLHKLAEAITLSSWYVHWATKRLEGLSRLDHLVEVGPHIITIHRPN